ncbi:MAG: serine/threonine protein kinase [Bacteriovoracaceae bacterium]
MSDDSNKLQRFGRYLILDHLVDGGMAKICRARFLSDQADKIVAIKMVQAQYSKDESFKQMFMDELKVAFSLQHPNIIQTYDYGFYQEQLFVAMEYCDGRNLKEYLGKLRQKKFVFPVEISTFIISQVCQGLHYAHTLTDKLSGEKNQIIHRDISPHNIMLTFDGSIKIIDFGIAKSDKSSEKTQAGTIKGKLSYLAPEYIEGMELDPRYDQFAVGITFWEMLCSRKLFKAANDIAILKKIQECKVPRPSDINPNVPKELDQIILKALSPNREDRFENLDKMNRALMKFLYTHYQDFNSTDLSYFAKELFKDEIRADSEKLFEYGKIDIKPYIDEYNNEQGQEISSGSKDDGKVKKVEKPELGSDIEFADGFDIMEESVQAAASSPESKTKAQNSSQLAVDLPSERVESTRASKSRRSSATQLSKQSRTRHTRLNKDTGKKSHREESKGGGLKIAFIAGLSLVGLYFLNPTAFQNVYKKIAGPEEQQVSPGDQGIERKVAQNDPQQVEVKEVKLIDLRKHRDKVFINGEEVKPSILSKVSIPLEGKVLLRIQRDGRQHFIQDLTGKVMGLDSLKVEETSKEKYGFLTTSRKCASGTVSFTLFGEKRVEKLPISKNPGIWLPVSRVQEGRKTASAFSLKLRLNDEKIIRKVDIVVSNEFDIIDLCDYLNSEN